MDWTPYLPVINTVALAGFTALFGYLHISNRNAAEEAAADVARSVDDLADKHETLAATVADIAAHPNVAVPATVGGK